MLNSQEAKQERALEAAYGTARSWISDVQKLAVIYWHANEEEAAIIYSEMDELRTDALDEALRDCYDADMECIEVDEGVPALDDIINAEHPNKEFAEILLAQPKYREYRNDAQAYLAALKEWLVIKNDFEVEWALVN